MTQFYLRSGAALSEKLNSTVHLGKSGVSGYISQNGPCSRCGGAGGSPHWFPEGGVCFRCRGHNSQTFETHTDRVFTSERLAVIVAAAVKKEAKRKAVQDAKDSVAHLEFVQWARNHKKVIGGIVEGKGNSFLESLKLQLAANKILSDRQVSAAVKTLERAEKRAVEGAASEFVGEVKQRIEFEAEVIGVYGTEGFYGHTDIVKFKDADGNLFTWFATALSTDDMLEHGDRMSIKGTIKKHEEYRDVKQTVMTRCKYTKFTVMTPDEAAQAEAVA